MAAIRNGLSCIYHIHANSHALPGSQPESMWPSTLSLFTSRYDTGYNFYRSLVWLPILECINVLIGHWPSATVARAARMHLLNTGVSLGLSEQT